MAIMQGVVFLLFFLCVDAEILQLHRVHPLDQDIRWGQLKTQDFSRNNYTLDLPVLSHPRDMIYGVYFTKIKIGSPPKEFNVVIDTGSDVIWVSCNFCNNCIRSVDPEMQLNFFDPTSSSTASLVDCAHHICTSKSFKSMPRQCLQNHCSYSITYQDRSVTSGYYVLDDFLFDDLLGRSFAANASSSQLAFGCSTDRSGTLAFVGIAHDGIVGFGQGAFSLVSQLHVNAFSHCLKADDGGGGVLVLGEILLPNIIYTPMVPSKFRYNLYLQSIAVNGQLLLINSKVFIESKSNHGTIIDTGTNLAYLIEEAYEEFITAVNSFVPQNVTRQIYEGKKCYLVLSGSISDIFPVVDLNFAGNASMTLNPKDYLMNLGPVLWCIGIEKMKDKTVLGDLILKDKIIVYDLTGQRIGWVNYNCSNVLNDLPIYSSPYIRHKNDAQRIQLHLMIIYFICLLCLLLNCN